MVSFPQLADALDAHASRYGGKGANLARLTAHGLPVPPGFLIDVQGVAAIVRGDTEAGEALAEAAGTLGAGPVAVRSSAVDEDGAGASFAGQHLTVLDVEGVEAIGAAVVQCAASAQSEAAAAYRRQSGTMTEAPGMAVVVQRMVAAEAAGVAFTADPTTGDTGRIIVEAVHGLGVGLVDGTVEGDRIVFVREGLALVEEHRPGSPALSVEAAREVARLALRCEEIFGAPQDIEFAVVGGATFLLQSRPVTALGGGDALGWTSEFDSPTTDDEMWTSANVQEVLPGLLTPYTISSFQQHLHTAYTAGYQELRLLRKDEWPNFVGVFYNRAFLNVNATRLIAERAFGASGDSVEHRFLGGELKLEPSGSGRFANLGRKLLSTPYLVRMTLQMQEACDRADARVHEWERRMRGKDFSLLDDGQLERWRVATQEFAARTVKTHLRATGAAGVGFEWTAGILRPLLAEDTEGTLPSLFSGMRGIESAQISIDLWNLSRTARETGVDALWDEDGFDPGSSALPPAWRSRYMGFMERHGHRGLNEMEASAKPWRADPAPVMQILRSYLAMPEEHSPVATIDRQEAERLRLTDELAGRMNPVKRAAFRRVLSDAQRGVAQREQMKSVIVRAMRLSEYLLPEITRRLIDKGCITDPSDIYFVTQDEISRALSGDPQDLHEAVVRRRREYERNRYVLLPERFSGRPVPIAPEGHAEGATTLTGTPVSPGVVTGVARVILDPSRDAPLQPGEVLVAPVTDAGWTPLFALASGLVVDMGSALSHGSTVAREYGLPGVVNVRGATRIIRSGDLVTIDGSKGTVTVVPAEVRAD